MQRSGFSVLLMALLMGLCFSRAVVAQEIASDDAPLRIETELAGMTVSVRDRSGRAVTGLERSAFTVFHNARPQEISFFGTDNTPASVSIVFDTSASMDGRKLELARQALARFIATSHPDDEFFLIDFNSKARLLIDRTRDADAVLKQLTYVNPTGRTALFDAVKLGVERAESGSRTKKIVLVISDGEDNGSRASFSDVRRQLRESDGVVYAVGYGGLMTRKGFMSGRDTLSSLASASGGAAYFPDGDVETDEIFERIALDIRNLYTLGYYPDGLENEPTVEDVRIEVKTGRRDQPLLVRKKRIIREVVNE